MSWRRRTYVLHRWIGLVVSLQLLAWSVGGLLFSLVPPDTLHERVALRERRPVPLDVSRVAVGPGEAIARWRESGADASGLGEVVLRSGRAGEPVYELRRQGAPLALVDATDGTVRPPVDRALAEELVRADFARPVHVAATELLTGELPLEARGRRLPLWRVELAEPRRPRIYLDAVTGEVVARRNSVWRAYDFFYMLHLMDYSEREKVHHPLLSIAAALAVLTSMSGVALWTWRAMTRKHS